MNGFTVRSSDLERCPTRNLTASHWRPDGTCRCAPSRRRVVSTVLLAALLVVGPLAATLAVDAGGWWPIVTVGAFLAATLVVLRFTRSS